MYDQFIIGVGMSESSITDPHQYSFKSLWAAWELCLVALVIWREARGEPYEGKIAVAHTIKNRVHNPAWWGRSYADVVCKKWQYSSLTDPNDRQLTTWPKADDHTFEECLKIAERVITGVYNAPLKGIDSYYDDSLQGEARPKWAKEHPERFVGKIGKLNFFNLDCDVEVITNAAMPHAI
jgi:N-acetylmuramoyl-L-alanine amidase